MSESLKGTPPTPEDSRVVGVDQGSPAAKNSQEATALAIRTLKLSLWYGTFRALFEVDFQVKSGLITALIGPSGCGKTTLLRCVNRINKRISSVRTQGSVEVFGQNIYEKTVELAQLRCQVGMVFQRPNPLPISVRNNVLFGYDIHSPRNPKEGPREKDEIVEQALRQVLLWDTVKDRLGSRATELSLEEQQKLCIARLLPVKPTVLLMDEPCSALDPEGTEAVEELLWELRGQYSILIVTHNMAQARRASDECAFMLLGKLIEHTKTGDMFVTPQHQETADYIEGRYG